MDSLTDFVQQWGYWAVFFGSLIEGEAVIFTASFMAYKGYLSLFYIIIVAFTGTFLAEQTLYYVGRRYGTQILEKYPRFKEPSERAFRLLKRFDKWFILACRFIYGIRNISPMVIGMSGIPPKRYLPLNLIAAAFWSIISCVGAYLMGQTIELIMDNFQLIQKYLILGGAGIGIIVFGVLRFLKKKKANSQ